MVRYFSIIWTLCLLFLLSGCEEEFDVDIPDSMLDGIVFNGVITSENPPYFFLLRKPALISGQDGQYEGIEDATMIVTDCTDGIKDTMQVLHPYDDYGGVFYDYYDYYQKKSARVAVNPGHDNISCRGMYATTKIYGIEGHYYQFDIFYGGKHYKSDIQRMESALPITDMKLKRFDFNEKGHTWAPCISFINPFGVDNYYLFQLNANSYTNYSLKHPQFLLSSGQFWGYSILSDEYLEENVVDFLIDDGENPLGYPPGWDYPMGDSLYVWAQTISRSCYDVFDQMIRQFRSDGGAYTPAPSSVGSNISGRAYGCFRVSAVSEKGIATGER